MAQLLRITCLGALLGNILTPSLALVSAAALGNSLTDRAVKPVGRILEYLSPPPQEITYVKDCSVSLKGSVTIVTGKATDNATITTIEDIVTAAGGETTVSSEPTGNGIQIYIGTVQENSGVAAIAKALTGATAKGLAADGYVLAAGTYKGSPTIVLNGVDTRGTFYASQTLRQLAQGRTGLQGVTVRDWPLMPIRGSIEGFYGDPWSQQARLDQYVFYGKHKMNTYIYTPKNDNLLRADWRDLYNASALAQLQTLVNGANGNHVDFTFALSPGLDLCYSSDADFNTTITKFDQVRGLGVHSFYIAFDDIPVEFHCKSDTKMWPPSKNSSDLSWLAAAQASYLNRLQKEYIDKYGLDDLQTVPTDYSGSNSDPYKLEFGTKLNKSILIQWTGEGVFSPTVTAQSVQQADVSYVTDKIYFWDNFPVNDGMLQRIFLTPLTGRAPDLYNYLLGFTSNPMVQAYASMIALANYGDYTWNGPAYNAKASEKSIIWELTGTSEHVHDAVEAFVDINQNWPYRANSPNATALTKDIDTFWAARSGSYGTSHKQGSKPLLDRLDLLTKLPKILPRMAMAGFGPDVAPWSTAAMQWATACQHLIAVLDALDKGNKSKAKAEFKTANEWVNKTMAATVPGRIGDPPVAPTTGDGVFNEFLANVTAIYESS